MPSGAGPSPSGRRRGAPRASSSALGGAGLLAAGRYSIAILGWAGTALIARTLTNEDFGAFTFVFSFLGLIGFLTDLRMSRLVLSALIEADDAQAGRVAGSYTALRIVIGLVSYAIAVGIVVFGGWEPPIVAATAIGGLALVLLSTWHGPMLLCESRFWQRSVAQSQIAGQLVQFGVILLIIVLGTGSVVTFALPAAVNAVVTLVVLALVVRASIPLQLRIEPALWWTWLKEAAPLSLGYALETIYFRIDVMMLSALGSLTAVGLYGVGYKFSDLMGAVPAALLAPALTLMVRDREDPVGFHRTFRNTFIVLCIAAMGVAVGFAFFARELIALLYGGRYAEAADAARLLMVGQALHFFTALCFVTLVAAGRNRLYPVATLAGVIANVGLNLLWIPRYSYLGAGYATVVTELLVLAVLAWGVLRVPGVRPLPARALSKVLLAGAVLAAVLALGSGRVPWFVLAALAPILYLALVHFLRVDGRGGLRTLLRNARIQPIAAEPIRPDREPELIAVNATGAVSGAEKVLVRALVAARVRGWTVRCACPDGPLVEVLAREGIARIAIDELKLGGAGRVRGLLGFVRRSRAAGRTLARQVQAGPNAVFLVNGLNALLAVRWAGVDIPVAYLVHDVIVRGDRRRFLRFVRRDVDLAIAVSDAVAGPLRQAAIATVVVRNGTEWPVAPGAPDPSGPKIVGCSALLTPWKGHDVLLDAWAHVHRENAVLEFIGGTLPSDAPYAARLRERAARPDLAGRVRIVGHVDDPLARMRTWTLAVSASVDPEAAPLNVLEGMSLGLPFVATAHGGTVEVLGEAGVLVPPRDPLAMARAITALLDDDAARARCSAAGRAQIADGLTLEHHLDRLLGVIDDLARGHAVRAMRP